MNIIPEWRRAWRFLSVHVATAAVTFGLLPPEQQHAILAALSVPPERVPAVLGALFLLARFVKIDPKAPPGDAPKDDTP